MSLREAPRRTPKDPKMLYVYQVHCEGVVQDKLCWPCARIVSNDVRGDFPELDVVLEADPVHSRSAEPAIECSNCGTLIERC